MRVAYRIYGAIIMFFVFVGVSLFILMQENWSELWVGLAFSIAFSIAMVIYVKSNMTEKTRLQEEKKKKKGKTNQHEKRK